MNLEHIKLELQELTNKVNELETQNNGAISLTKEQLKELILTVQEQTMEFVRKEIKDSHIFQNAEDYVELELCGNSIEMNVDRYSLSRDIVDDIGSPNDEVTDEEIDAFLVKLQK